MATWTNPEAAQGTSGQIHTAVVFDKFSLKPEG